MEKSDVSAMRKKSDDASAAIGVKLLQGWTLLNDYCPQCLTPLVRNREKRIYCVGCSQWVITEMEAAARALENPVDRFQSPESAAALSEPAFQNRDMGNVQQRMTASSPAQQVEPSNFATFNSNAKPQAGIDGPMKSNDGSPSNQNPGKMTSLVLSKVELPSNTRAVFSQTLSTLVQKIEETSKLIPVTHEPLVIKQLLDIIEQCVHVIQQITTFSSR